MSVWPVVGNCLAAERSSPRSLFEGSPTKARVSRGSSSSPVRSSHGRIRLVHVTRGNESSLPGSRRERTHHPLSGGELDDRRDPGEAPSVCPPTTPGSGGHVRLAGCIGPRRRRCHPGSALVRVRLRGHGRCAPCRPRCRASSHRTLGCRSRGDLAGALTIPPLALRSSEACSSPSGSRAGETGLSRSQARLTASFCG
jgi:hypothetical protein